MIEDGSHGIIPFEEIYCFGGNMETRQERSQNNTMVSNGGGGEIYQDFFICPIKAFHSMIQTIFFIIVLLKHFVRMNLMLQIIKQT